MIRTCVGDSQVASRWGNILDFSDFDHITPNEKEARFALGDQVLQEAGRQIPRVQESAGGLLGPLLGAGGKHHGHRRPGQTQTHHDTGGPATGPCTCRRL